MHQKIKIIIVGNGFGGTYTLKHLDKIFRNNKDVEITLVGEKNYFLFTPLLHEVATGSINPENIIESIHKVLGRCLSHFYLGKVDFVDTKKKEVSVGEFRLPYDYLVLAPGAETNFYNIKGAEEHSLTLKSLEDAIKIKNHLISTLEKASHIKDRDERRKKLSFVIVGGGSTGVELAAEMSEFLKDTFANYYPPEIIEDISITLIQKTSELMPTLNKRIRRKALEVLQQKRVRVLLNSEVREVSESYIRLGGDKVIGAGSVIWVAGIKPREVKFDKEIEKNSDDRILINNFLQIKDLENVYALGDLAVLESVSGGSMLPSLAQVAEKQAKRYFPILN